MTTVGASEAELRAARLTLLTLRGAVPDDLPFRPGIVRLPPVSAPVSDREAELALALRTKPLECYADVEEDVLTVVARRVANGPASALRWPDDTSFPPHPDFGDLSRVALCLGRPDDWLCITLEELEAWKRAYSCLPSGYVAGEYRSRLDIPEAARREAEARGAVALLRFWAPHRADPVAGRLYITRIERGADAQEVAVSCERCRARPAQYEVSWYEDPRPRRSLCQHCIDVEFEVEQFDTARSLERWAAELADAERTQHAEELSEMAHFNATWWAFKPKPPWVRAFIVKHRRY